MNLESIERAFKNVCAKFALLNRLNVVPQNIKLDFLIHDINSIILHQLILKVGISLDTCFELA